MPKSQAMDAPADILAHTNANSQDNNQGSHQLPVILSAAKDRNKRRIVIMHSRRGVGLRIPRRASALEYPPEPYCNNYVNSHKTFYIYVIFLFFINKLFKRLQKVTKKVDKYYIL